MIQGPSLASDVDREPRARLDSRLQRLTYDDVVDWMGERYAGRAWNYRERVRDVYFVADGYVATVEGSELYAVKLTADPYGEFESVCACPIGGNCKHAGALAFVVSERMKGGRAIESNPPEALLRELELKREERRAAACPPEPPPRPRVRIEVEANPFGRFTALGGRHARDYSFRVVAGERVYHWSFIISTLVCSLAKQGLSYSEQGACWCDEPAENDPPLFTCSCGDAHCGGFGDQRCVFSSASVVWEVEVGREIVEFVFERAKYEAWVVEMLWRMRGGRHLRRDPWGDVVDSGCFMLAVDALFAANPRCCALWRRLEANRRLANEDLKAIATVSCSETPRVDRRCFFGRSFSTKNEPDLRQSGPMRSEITSVDERLKEVCLNRLGCFAYLPVYAPRWQPTEIRTGDELEFVRETDAGVPQIRVVSVTRKTEIGRVRREDAQWLAAMMDRHGMVLKGHVEPARRYDKGLLVRIDMAFPENRGKTFDWGASLDPRDRLYFEMIRSVALRLTEYPVRLIQAEVKRLESVLHDSLSCPEIAFLFATVTASAREVEARMTDEAVAKRLARCARIRRALDCRPVGDLLPYAGLQVQPLVANDAVDADGSDAVPEQARHFIRLVWGRDPNPRVKVSLPDFPEKATGFAVFRNGELLDLCLTGVPIARAEMFDNLAIYAQEGVCTEDIDAGTASERIRLFLDELPIREPDQTSHEFRYWLERGIHDGTCCLDGQDRLVSLRVVMLSARKAWCD